MSLTDTSNVKVLNGRLLKTQEPDLVIFFDALLSGWGGGGLKRSVGKRFVD
jgi:hypothetical protein